MAIERGNGDEHARAVAGKPLRLDDRPGGGARRNFDVGDVLVLQRLGNEQWRISAKFGIDVPTRQVAADKGPAVAHNPRGNHQDDADDGVGALQQIAKSRQTRRYAAFGEAAQPEELEFTLAEASRQQFGNRVEIALAYFATANLRSRLRRHG